MIRDYIKKFETEENLKRWLKKQNKDTLYIIYSENCNGEELGYREVTRKELKDMFLEAYYIEKDKEINYI